MATYEDIRKANAAISTTDIKGKEYAEVNQRVKAFRMVYPEGGVSTELISLEAGVCVMKATCFDEAGNILGVGHAYEKEGSSFINKTSYIENCETSAVGRALGMAGFGIDTSICSAEELQNAVLNQDKRKKDEPKTAAEAVKDAGPDLEGTIADTPDAVKKLQDVIKTVEDAGGKGFVDELKETFGIKKIEDIKKKDYRGVIASAQARYELLKGASNE